MYRDQGKPHELGTGSPKPDAKRSKIMSILSGGLGGRHREQPVLQFLHSQEIGLSETHRHIQMGLHVHSAMHRHF